MPGNSGGSRRRIVANHKAKSVREIVAAADTPVTDLPDVPPGTEVIFQGPAILALNQATNSLTASAKFLRHALIRDRYFFTLPRGLWDQTYRQIGADAFVPELTELEDELGAICRDHSSNAGLWHGRAFVYNYLRRSGIPRISAAEMRWDINQASLDRQLRIAEQRLNGAAITARGYLGWLSVNPQFLDEHDALLHAHHKAIARWGTAAFGLPTLLPELEWATTEEKMAFQFADGKFVEFFCRWRLQGLAAPYLPIPLGPLLAGQIPPVILQRYLQTGGLFVIPDTFPIPSRDEFRGMLDDALHASPPEYLTEWMTIIAGNNTGKQQISRFARLFELRHFWCVLHHRHSAALYRKSTVLKQVLASFLRTSEKSIHADLIEIRRRLGENWMQRGAGSPLGPF
jgi:hypothetical protein